MTTAPNDPSLALSAVSQQDLVQRKQNIDALRERLGDNKSKEQELRESCEGFESIFLQKMWEQMRKNVPKEGYLHSKDEEMYQSLFDVELSKKMTSAGGIGLADMLYEQLSQQLVNTGRTTSPSTYRPPVIPPTTSAVLAANKAAAEAPQKIEPKPVLTVENLYTPLEEAPVEEEPKQDPISLALAEFAKIVKETPESTKVEPGRVVANGVSGGLHNAASGALPKESALIPDIPLSAEGKNNSPVTGEKIQAASWHNTARVSATPRPVSKFSRRAKADEDASPVNIAGNTAGNAPVNAPANVLSNELGNLPGNLSDNASVHAFVNEPALGMPSSLGTPSVVAQPAAQPAAAIADSGFLTAMRAGEESGILPDRAFWPIEGKVRTPFGWYEGANNHQDWNPGIFIDAAEGARVAACMKGEIVYSGEAEGFDNMVILDHGENYRSYYGNVRMHGLEVGDSVQGGMLFASVTTPDQKTTDTAKSSAFYFGLKRGDMALNPELAIPRFLTAQR